MWSGGKHQILSEMKSSKREKWWIRPPVGLEGSSTSEQWEASVQILEEDVDVNSTSFLDKQKLKLLISTNIKSRIKSFYPIESTSCSRKNKTSRQKNKNKPKKNRPIIMDLKKKKWWRRRQINNRIELTDIKLNKKILFVLMEINVGSPGDYRLTFKALTLKQEGHLFSYFFFVETISPQSLAPQTFLGVLRLQTTKKCVS